MRHLNLKTKDFAEAKEIGFKKGEIFPHRTQRRDFKYLKSCAIFVGILFNVDSIFDTVSFFLVFKHSNRVFALL